MLGGTLLQDKANAFQHRLLASHCSLCRSTKLLESGGQLPYWHSSRRLWCLSHSYCRDTANVYDGDRPSAAAIDIRTDQRARRITSLAGFETSRDSWTVAHLRRPRLASLNLRRDLESGQWNWYALVTEYVTLGYSRSKPEHTMRCPLSTIPSSSFLGFKNTEHRRRGTIRPGNHRMYRSRREDYCSRSRRYTA